jgi:8-oxo-dGTP pyrophosphatase MutT (NUDIX family)
MIGADIVAAILSRLTVELAPPPRGLRPWVVDGRPVGWLDDRRADRIARFEHVFRADGGRIAFVPGLADFDARTRALHEVARTLAAEGALSAWRGERYAVADSFGERPRFELERAAARYFGIRTFAAHVNGLSRDTGAVAMWFARRSPAKAIDPGLLDNLVGGGIPAGGTAAAAVVREAWEEAGIPATTAAHAAAAGTVQVCRLQPDGLQRETIFVHDLWLPRDFEPVNRDGEVVGFRRVDLAAAARLIANSAGADVATADASLVVLDCLLRHGAIPPASPEWSALDALRTPDCAAFG